MFTALSNSTYLPRITNGKIKYKQQYINILGSYGKISKLTDHLRSESSFIVLNDL